MTRVIALVDSIVGAKLAGERRLRLAAIAFGVGSAVHIADHLRRGQGSVTELLYVLGNVALVLQVSTVVLILVRHRLAPLIGMVVGAQLAIGFFAAHWLPHWSSMSDPVWQVHSARWFSYLASTAEIAGAVAVSITGAAIVRARGLASFAATSPS